MNLHDRELFLTRWVLGQLTCLVCLPGIFTVDTGGGWLAGFAIASILLISLIPHFIRYLRWVESIYVLLLVIGLLCVDFFLAGGDFLPPLIRLLSALILLRALQFRSNREDFQLIIMNLFLLLITGVLSQELFFAFQALIFLGLASCHLIILNVSEHLEINKTVGGFYFQKGDGRIIWKGFKQRMKQRFWLFSFLLYLATVTLSLALFFLLPRFELGQSLPFLQLQSANSLSGFSDTVKFGDIVSILEDETIAMRVDVEGVDPPVNPYWRMVALDYYFEEGFSTSSSVRKRRKSYNSYRFTEYREASQLEAVTGEWTFYFEGSVSAYLPSVGSFDELTFNNRQKIDYYEYTRAFKQDKINANTLFFRYTGVDHSWQIPVNAVERKLESFDGIPVFYNSQSDSVELSYPETLLAYPGGKANEAIMQRILDLIGFNEEMGVGEFSRRLKRYFEFNRGYSLNTMIPDGDEDILLRWVASNSNGHCELFAGSFVLISRFAGFPARMVTGFMGGDWNGYEGYYMVRNKHAHAWVEVLDIQSGWLTVDPTPGNSVEPEAVSNALERGAFLSDRTIAAYLDSLRVLWFRRIIQFDADEQAELTESGREISKKILSSAWSSLKAYWAQLESVLSSMPGFKGQSKWMTYSLLIVLHAGVLLLCFWIFRRSRKRFSYEAHLRRKAGRLLVAKGLGLAESESDYPELEAVLRIRFADTKDWPASPEKALKEFREMNSQNRL